jgi:YggT family protein
MNEFGIILYNFLAAAVQIYVFIIIIGAVLSWLVAFDVVNTRNRLVAMILEFTYRLTEPALRPIRSVLPNLGGIDISPIILLLILWYLVLPVAHIILVQTL